MQLLKCSFWWRAFDQYYMARFADILGEPRLTRFFAVTASVLARKLEIIYLQKKTREFIDELMGEEGEGD